MISLLAAGLFGRNTQSIKLSLFVFSIGNRAVEEGAGSVGEEVEVVEFESGIRAYILISMVLAIPPTAPW